VVTERLSDLELVGGNVALDLANTLEGPRVGEPDQDHLPDHEALVEWALLAGVITSRPATRPAELLEHVRRLRAAIFDVFFAVATGSDLDPAALAELTAIHADALEGARLMRRAGGSFDYGPDLLLTPAQAAVDLLRHGPLDRVNVCAACRWLFLDASRNHSRRWCSMNECGGRLKMRRYRERRATAGR
jgi:predicted RNA-binding Zn ribbon-like protein